jgi:hypothetical protein
MKLPNVRGLELVWVSEALMVLTGYRLMLVLLPGGTPAYIVRENRL